MNGVSGFLVTHAFEPVLNSLWQGVIIAALAWLLMRSLPRLNAATRYVIWWAVLMLVLLLPFVPARRQTSQAAPVVVSSATGGSINPLLPDVQGPALVEVRPTSMPKWPLEMAAAWALLFLFRLARIAVSFLFLRRVKRRAMVSSEPLPPIGRNARLLISKEISSPMAAGFMKPAVILPESLRSELETTDFDHVVLHETAHLARRDDWTNLVARLLDAVFVLHPVVLWVLRRMDREREIACDEWVVARTGHARDYAASLARMYELRGVRNQEVLASGVFGRGSRLSERVELLVARDREFSARISVRRILLSTAILLALAAAGSRAPQWIAFAEPRPRPAFEVASVKPGNPSARFSTGVQGNLFVANNAPLSILVGFAYSLQLHQIFGGPKWINTDRFTVRANAPIPGSPEPTDRVRLMLQSLLAERFRLAVHRETRTEQVYGLVVARGGPKLKETAGAGPHGTGIFGSGRPNEINAHSVTVAELVALLSQRLGSPVTDKTGLTGKYDFTLSFAPTTTQQDLALFGAPPPEAIPPADSGLPSIFTAVQEQLGLKLEFTKGPVEVLVIDRAEHPDPN